jgi:hypothetical protein
MELVPSAPALTGIAATITSGEDDDVFRRSIRYPPTGISVAARRLKMIAAGVMACAEPARTTSRLVLFLDYPFELGFASDAPSADGFVLWTRLCPDPLHEGGIATRASRKRKTRTHELARTLFSAASRCFAAVSLAVIGP